MNIQTIEPNPLLSDVIDFYYFIKNDKPDFQSKHYSFPHTVNVITIYKEASLLAVLGKAAVYHDPSQAYLTILQSKCQLPLEVTLTGKMDRISIFFKPLGLNQFLDDNLSNHLRPVTSVFQPWQSDPTYSETLENCFCEKTNQRRIQVLENFLIQRRKTKSFPAISKAIEMLTNFEENYGIQNILEETQMPLRSFNRAFKNAIGVSPKEYQRIARFRHSLDNKLFSAHFKKLTKIGYESNFYDQSYFIKMYRKLTGSNPKTFFKQIDRLAEDKLIFKFING